MSTIPIPKSPEFSQTGLINLHHHHYLAQYKPATYQCSSKPINIIAGTDLFAAALESAWILPFGLLPLINEDHCLLGINFNPDILFGNMPATPVMGMIWGLNSNHKQHFQIFCKEVIKKCNQLQLAEWIDALQPKPTLTDADILELESVNALLTKILVKANQKCCPTSNIPWSPAVQNAFLKHCYWTLKLAAFQNQCNLKSSIEAIAARLTPEDIVEDPCLSLSTHLRHTQKELKAAQKDVAHLRQHHLEAILNQVIAANHRKKLKMITYLIHVECNRQYYFHFRQHTKPKAPSGLAFVNVPDLEGRVQPVLDHSKMEAMLLEYSRTHFAKAERSPFTTEPLG